MAEEDWDKGLSRDEDGIDWKALVEVEAADARRSLNPVDLENHEHRFVRRMYEEISGRLPVLQCRAMIEADKYAVAEKESRGDKANRSGIRCRVRTTNSNTLEIAWYRLKSFRIPENAAVVRGKTFQKNVNGQSAVYMMRGEHLKKGKHHRYPITQFKNEPIWVQRIVEENEAKNEILRKQSEILTQIRRLLCQFDRLTAQYYDDLVHPAFEEKRIPPVSLKGVEPDEERD